MQRYRRHRHPAAGILIILSLAAVGCPASPPTAPTAQAKPFAGVTLTVVCPDPAFARALPGRAAGWAGRTGAAVTWIPDVNAADVVVVRPAAWGSVAADLTPVPPDLRAADHPVQRGRIIEAYRDALPGWAGDALGLPVVGDGFALVTRADRLADPAVVAAFRAKFDRPPDVPRTYEDVADLAEVVARVQGKPSLPPLAGDGPLLGEFHRVAACYDRPAVASRAAGVTADPAGLSLHFVGATPRPRLTTPGFRAAAAWLARTAPHRLPAGPNPDPVAALDGSAVAAVLTLAEVGRLPRDPATGAVAGRFAVARLPGTRTYFDAAGKEQPAAGQGNYVPFVGDGSLVAGVRKTCATPAAAWDFVADLAGPVGSLAGLNDPAVGGGPFRREHLEPGRDSIWLAYQFDPAGSARLADALRANAAVNVVNPATVYRGPDQPELMAALAAAIRQAATGGLPPAAALAQAEAAWAALDAKRDAADLARRRRNAAGLP